MPIYDYLCGRCNKKYSFLILKPGEEAEARCPSCGAPEKSKLMSKFAVGKGDGGTSEDDFSGPEDSDSGEDSGGEADSFEGDE